MKPSFTLIDIVNFGTVGDDHLAGEARFSDGKRYRFVINSEMDYSMRTQAPTRKAPAVLKMALPYVGAGTGPGAPDWAWGNDHRIFPKRAALIMQVYPDYLAKAKVEKERADAEYDAKQKAEQLAHLRDKALRDAAPELLEALRPFASLDVRHMISLGKKSDHPIFGLNATQFTLGDVLRAVAAISKATNENK